MDSQVAVTGAGAMTPLGSDPAEVLRRLEAGETAARPPRRFDPSPFSCRLVAEIDGLAAEEVVPDPKAVRLMGRDAVLAAAAARAALREAGILPGRPYAPEDIALFGSTGLAGLDVEDAEPLLRHAAGAGGSFDPRRFGAEALKRVRPILSFRILGNMAICFVSIFEGIRGPNAVYNPWEGQGARAIERGIAAVCRGEAPCALVGGCDAKTNLFAFVALEQAGALRAGEVGRGTVPAEGAAFIVLEEEGRARSRGARILARVRAAGVRTANGPSHLAEVRSRLVSDLEPGPRPVLVSGDEGDGAAADAEERGLRAAGAEAAGVLRPKTGAGNLFAAAAALQVALAAALLAREDGPEQAIAACFGHGSEQGAFLLESAGPRTPAGNREAGAT